VNATVDAVLTVTIDAILMQRLLRAERRAAILTALSIAAR
jgi:hypothetical protein